MKYNIDSNNNLNIYKKNKQQTLKGYFKLKQNNLYYVPSNPNLEEIYLKGKWKLDKNHNFIFILSNKDKLNLKTQILQVSPKKILFTIESKTYENKYKTNILKIYGNWTTSPKNNLYFNIQKKDSKDNTLKFTGIWSINKNYKIIYSYKKTELKTKTTKINSFSFEGKWKIIDKTHLTFFINNQPNHALNFKVSLGTKNIYAKKGEIKYKIGIKLSNKKKKDILLTLFGSWKISNKLNITFETPYNNSNYTSSFKTVFNVSKKDKIEAKLFSKKNKITGLTVIFNKSFFENSNFFLLLKNSIKEKQAKVGMTIPF
jgi:hypothetical protein